MSRLRIARQLREQVYDDFAGICAFCHSPEVLMDGLYEVDHIVPHAHQGATARSNLCLTCALCNRYKGALLRAIDPLTGRRVRLYHPREQNWSRHFAWSSDGLIIYGRTQAGRATVFALKLNDARRVRLRSLWIRLNASPPDWRISEHPPI